MSQNKKVSQVETIDSITARSLAHTMQAVSTVQNTVGELLNTVAQQAARIKELEGLIAGENKLVATTSEQVPQGVPFEP